VQFPAQPAGGDVGLQDAGAGRQELLLLCVVVHGARDRVDGHPHEIIGRFAAEIGRTWRQRMEEDVDVKARQKVLVQGGDLLRNRAFIGNTKRAPLVMSICRRRREKISGCW